MTSLRPEQAVALVLKFYEQTRVEGCALDEDGDMLLGQWGIYDFTGQEWFHFDLTRQFILGDSEDDEDINQLSLTLFFDPIPDLRAIQADNKWCASLDDLTEFENFIKDSAAYQVITSLKPAKIEMNFDSI